MSNIRKALENENVSEDKIKEILKELGIEDSKRWVPWVGEEYWLVDVFGEVWNLVWDGGRHDDRSLLTGNVFRTEQEAEYHRDKINFLAQMKIDFEDNSDEIDWSSGSATKYHIQFPHSAHKIEVDGWNTVQQQGAMLTTNRDWLEQYIIDNEENIKKYCFGIE